MSDYKDVCEKFNNNRIYYDGSDYNERIKTYLDNINNNNFIFNSEIPEKRHDKIRILNMNVRYWTDIYNRPSFDKHLKNIKELEPDIILMQEFTLGNNKYYDINDFNKLYNELISNHKLISVCSAVPSWYSDLYGNAIFMNKKFIEKILNSDRNNQLYNYLCNYNENICSFNQHIENYIDVPRITTGKISGQMSDHMSNQTSDQISNQTSDQISDQMKDKMNKHMILDYDKTNDNKCFIKISLHDFDLFCVHLDAYSIENRKQQLDQINKQISRMSIISGDFNFINPDIYLKYNANTNVKNELYYHLNRISIPIDVNDNDTVVRNRKMLKLKENYEYVTKVLKWYDISLDNCNINMSQWSGTKVDFAFMTKSNEQVNEQINEQINEQDKRKVKMFFYLTDASDHIPFIIDYDFDYNVIKPNTNANVNPNKIFNCQPMDEKTFLWIIDGKFAYSNDPYLTGNDDYSKKLGIYGIYTTSSLDEALIYGDMIKKNLSIKNEYKILFEFQKKDIINCNEKIVEQDGPINDKYNEEYNIITKHNIHKYTPKSFSPNGVPLCFDIIKMFIIIKHKMVNNNPIVKGKNDSINKYIHDFFKTYEKQFISMTNNDKYGIIDNIIKIFDFLPKIIEHFELKGYIMLIEINNLMPIINKYDNEYIAPSKIYDLILEYKLLKASKLHGGDFVDSIIKINHNYHTYYDEYMSNKKRYMKLIN